MANFPSDGMDVNTEINTSGFGTCPLPISDHDTVQLGHGSGGQMSRELIQDLFVWAFGNPLLDDLQDSVVLPAVASDLAFSTDSFVVDPIFFPGGNIGNLAVNGTVNDVAMSGATPRYLSIGMILEEGFSLVDLKRIVESIRDAAAIASVQIVTGDTKVVDKGKGDKVFINTTGIGVFEQPVRPRPDRIRVGDHVLISGTLADHGMTILSKREGLQFEMPIASDSAALNHLIARMLDVGGEGVRALRDPTRGGVAAALNEFAETAGVGIELEEGSIPILPAVRGACEFLGIDPLHVANEGKLIAVVAPEVSEAVLSAMKSDTLGAHAVRIGTVTSQTAGMVTMRTGIGGQRIVDMLVGEQLPRIC